VSYQYFDIDQDTNAQEYVKQQNYNKPIIPTILFADGSILVEPSDAELAAKLGLQTTASQNFYDLIIVGSGPA
jgi:thioredoxin reductase (NADPH)